MPVAPCAKTSAFQICAGSHQKTGGLGAYSVSKIWGDKGHLLIQHLSYGSEVDEVDEVDMIPSLAHNITVLFLPRLLLILNTFNLKAQTG